VGRGGPGPWVSG